MLIKTIQNTFRYNYRFDEKRKILASGVYPDILLKEARGRREISKSIEPCANKKAVKAAKVESTANSFDVIAREWGNKNIDTWDEKNNYFKRMLERNIFPWLGKQAIINIKRKV